MKKETEKPTVNWYDPTLYSEILAEKDFLKQKKLISDMRYRAEADHFEKSEFNAIIKSLLKPLEFKKESNEFDSMFPGQPIVLKTGDYLCDEKGVTINNELIITHPIMPTKILKNLEDESIKIEVSFCKDIEWQSKIFDKKVISSRAIVAGLSSYGVSVTEGNATAVSTYLSKIEDINYQILPKTPSIGRLGWVNGEFSPYYKGIIFDGELSNRSRFNAIKKIGDYELWRSAIVKKCENDVFRFMFLASIASPLLTPLNIMGFVVHIHGKTGGGKTLAMQAVLSAWGDPLKLIQSHNSTPNGIEASAYFMQSLPLCLDESQEAKTQDLNKILYMLANGNGKAAMTQNRTSRDIHTWRLIVISNGENPATDENSQAGALNRVLSVKCTEDFFDKSKEEGRQYAEIFHNNYGFIGEEWIKYIKENIEDIKQHYKIIVGGFSNIDTTGKQALAISVIATAREFFNRCFGWNLEDFGMKFFESVLYKTEDIVQEERAYDYLISEIASNESKFEKNTFERWGAFDDSNPNIVYIISAKLKKILQSGGFNLKAITDEWVKKGYFETVNKNKRMSGLNPKCYKIRLKNVEDVTEKEEDETY